MEEIIVIQEQVNMATNQKTQQHQFEQQLHEIGQSLITLQKTPEVLQQTLEKIAKTALHVLEADLVDLYQYKADDDQFILPPIMVGTHRVSDAVPKQISTDDVVYKVVHNIGKKIYVSDAQSYEMFVTERKTPDRNQPTERFAIREGVISTAAIPIIVEKEILGVMFVNYQKRCEFDTNTGLRQRIETFANFAGVAIQNARFLEQEQTLRRETGEEYQALSAISPTLELWEVAEKIIDELRNIIEFHKASLQVIQDDARTLLAGWGFNIKAAHPWFQRPLSKDPLVKRIVESQRPLILSDTSQTPDWGSDCEGTNDVKSWVGIPLVYEKKTIGIVTLAHRQSGFYTNKNVNDLPVRFINQAAINLHKAYLLDRAKREVQVLKIVDEIVQAISTKINPQNLLRTFVVQLANQLHCHQCTLFFPENNNGTLLKPKVTLCPELGDQSSKGPKVRWRSENNSIHSFRPGEGLVGWVYEKGESLVLDDATQDKRFVKTSGKAPHSIIVAPIKARGRTLGVISVAHDTIGWFDRYLVDALAKQLGLAIERANALELLQEINNQIISVLDVSDILQKIVLGAIKLTNTTTGAIYLIKENSLEIENTFHSPDFDHPAPRLLKKDGFTRQAINTGKVISIPDIRKNHSVNPVLQQRYKSMIVVPLKFEEKVIGVLYLDDENLHDFTETEISLLQTLTSQAAIAIKNARLLEEREQNLEELETLSYTATSLIGASTLTELSGTVLPIISQRLKSYAALYICSKNEPDGIEMQQQGCVPNDFASQLKTTFRYSEESPLNSVIPEGVLPPHIMDARGREGRLEGVVFVQRDSSVEKAITPFTSFEIRTLFLLATAIGHTLQNLRKEQILGENRHATAHVSI